MIESLPAESLRRNGWRSRLNTEPLRKNLLVTNDGGGGHPEDFPFQAMGMDQYLLLTRPADHFFFLFPV